MNTKTQEALEKIKEWIKYFEGKPHKIEKYGDEFLEDIIKYGDACRAEVMEILKDKV